MIMKTTSGKRKVYCAAVMKVVPSNIDECSDYQAKGSQSKYEMEKVAWVLEVKHGRTMGFKPPEEKKDPFG